MTAEDPSVGPAAASLVGRLRSLAERPRDDPAYTFLTDGEEAAVHLGFAELDLAARRLAGRLQEAGLAGERALLLFPPGLDFIAAFLGCLYAGTVAVPAYPPRVRRPDPRLRSIARDCAPRVVLTTAALAARSDRLEAANPELAGLPWWAADDLADGEADWRLPALDPGDLAFLQYTSGSTADPKGVMVTHGNLVHNEAMIRRAFAQDGDSVIVGWLPLYHDMGLIGNVLQPLYLGARCVLMSPLAFLQKPSRWLAAIHRYRGTTSGGPNFAYDLCVDRVRSEEAAEWDLSCWRVAFNGAEPVRAATLDRFAEAFRGHGFRRRAFYPCYGLAEATLLVTGPEPAGEARVEAFNRDELEAGRGVPAADGGGERRVACGRAWGGQEVVVVDTEAGRPAAPGRVGEIWVHGGSVAAGYWNRQRLSQDTFGARLAGDGRRFLRTGDLGFQDGDDLFVTGRAKDLLILRGRNVYPQDVEAVVEAVDDDLRPGSGAVFAVQADGEERMVVVHEVRRRRQDQVDGEALLSAVRAAVAEAFEVRPHEVVLVAARGVPKTSSGKIRRAATRQLYQRDALPVLARSGASEGASVPAAPPSASPRRAELAALAEEARRVRLRPYLSELVGRLAGEPPEAVEAAGSLAAVGLDSLRAVEVSNLVAAELGVTLPAAELLRVESFDDLVAAVAAAVTPEISAAEGTVGGGVGAGPGAATTGPATPSTRLLPLSPGQRGLWLADRRAPGEAVFHLGGALVPGGRVHAVPLARALAGLVARHGELRATFHDVDGEPRRTVHAVGSALVPALQEEDLGALDRSVVTERLADFVAAPFDLATGPPLRLGLFEHDDGQVLVLAVHHLVADLWSMAVLVRDLGALYRAELEGGEAMLPHLAASYQEVVEERWRRADGEDGEAAWQRWRQRLQDAPVLDLPTDRPRPPVADSRGGAVALRVPPPVAARLHAFARSRDATLFQLLLAAFQVLLHRWSGQEDLVVGAPWAGRDRPAWAPLIGYLVDMVPLRGDLSGRPSFAALLERTRAAALDDLAAPHYPFPLLAERLVPRHDPSRPPVFQAALALHRSHLPRLGDLAALALGGSGDAGPGTPARVDFAGLPCRPWPLPVERVQYELTLLAAEVDGGVDGSLRYRRDLWDATTAERLARHLERLLAAVAEDPGRRIEEVDLLSAAERETVRLLARPPAPRGDGRPVHARVVEWARRQPAAPALVGPDGAMTYGELEAASRHLAAGLRRAGVAPGDRVCLCLPGSPALVVAALAVLRAGAAYLPLDPAAPPRRLAGLVTEARPRLVLATPGHPLGAQGGGDEMGGGGVDGVEVTTVGSLTAGSPAPGATADLDDEAVDPRQAAYVIFTSGSTGRPNGVVVPHRGLARLVDWHLAAYGPVPGDRAAQVASPAFDASVWEVWSCLAAGAALHFPPPELRAAPGELAAWLVDQGITTAFLPTPLAEAVLAEPRWSETWRPRTRLRHLLTGGDRLTRRPPAGLPLSLVNHYGPTEASVVATAAPVAAEGTGAPPIGGPVDHVRALVMDPGLRPAPPGVVGELCLGGDGLARGYLDRPGLTARRFVPDPLAAQPGARLYRTGDLVRWRRLSGGGAGHELEFHGRADHQVQVRGQRVEPGEVEHALVTHPAVAEAAVELRHGVLTAWVVPVSADLTVLSGETGRVDAVRLNPVSLDPAELRRHLGLLLPAGVVPGRWVEMAALPLTANGKLDRRALPDPARDVDQAGAGDPPRGPLETGVAAIFAEILGLEAADAVSVNSATSGSVPAGTAMADPAMAGSAMAVPVTIGRQADFFALGGHSLAASRVVARVRRDLGVELPLRELYENPTVALLAQRVVALRGETETAGTPRKAAVSPPPVEPRPATAGPDLPLSWVQERLWFLERLAPGRAVYHVPAAVRLHGRPSVPALRAAWATVVRRHEVLRSRIVAVAGEPSQRPVPGGGPRLGVVDLAALPASRHEVEETRLVCRLAAAPLNLAGGRPARLALLRRGTVSALVLTLHHLVADGWSLGNLAAELGEGYAAALAGRPAVLPALPAQYADYALWQRRRLAVGEGGDPGAARSLAARLAAWRDRLEGFPRSLDLPTDRARPAVASFRGGEAPFHLADDAWAATTGAAAGWGVSPSTVLTAAFSLLLARYSGQRRLLLGTPMANRPRVELEDLVGLFANTLVLRAELPPALTTVGLVAATHDELLAAAEDQDLPFEKLVEGLEDGRDLSRNPLFQVMLALQRGDRLELRLPGLESRALPVPAHASRFDLTLFLVETANGGAGAGRLEGRLEYARDLYDRSTVERLLGHFRTLLAELAAAPAARVWDLPLLSVAERRQVVEEWNAPEPVDGPVAAAASLHGPVLARASAHPEAVALVVGEERWSYGRLAARSAALAKALRALGVGTESGVETRVGVCLRRHGDLVAALLAVLSAGGAYVPVDPAYPAERVRVMLADGAVEVLLTETALEDRLPQVAGVERLRVDEVPPRPMGPGVTAAPVAPDQLAYVLFTSGSTGRPKGVAIPHRGAAALVAWAWRRYSAAELSAVLAATSVCFDLSVFELFVPLSMGGRVILVDDALALSSAPAREQVSLVNTVPSALSALLAAEGLPASVRTVNLAGEALAASLAEAVYATGTVEKLYNLYGPSEDTTYSTWSLVPRPEPRGDRRPPAIGRPLSDTRAYVLDRLGRPVPVGVTGELCLAGAGLARGYLGRPAQTAEAFVPDPFAAAGGEPGGRLYRTGDLAHWRPDGELVFQGRADQQVKLRGFRIELGEVEAALAALPGVAEAAVAVWEDRLAGYVVGEDGLSHTGAAPDAAALDVAELRRGLSARLPAFMVPDLWHPLPALPRTPNGKLDRRSLPRPRATAVSSEPPRGDTETRLAALWCELLGVPRVGRGDDFFALGGHSLLATRLAARLADELEADVPLRHLFEAPTLAEQARLLETVGGVPPLPPVTPAPDTLAGQGAQPVSYAQERLWFLDRLGEGGAVYHLPAVLRLRGDLRVGALRSALDAAARRHGALRTGVENRGGRPVQRVAATGSLPVAVVDLSRPAIAVPVAAAGEAARLGRRLAAEPFDLERPPLARCALLQLGATTVGTTDDPGSPSAAASWDLVLVMHHLVSDGWSLAVLVREVGELYAAAAAGRPRDLPPLPVSYPDYAVWQRGWLAGDRLADEVAWWRRRLAGFPRTLELPTDRPRLPRPSFRGGQLTFTVEPGLLRRLEELAAGHRATPFMVWMAGFQLLLARLSGQRRLLVGSPVANRRRPELEGLVGLFVNTLVWRGDLPAEASFGDLLAATRRDSLEAQAHQDLPFEKLVEGVEGERDLSRNPLFQVMLVLQNAGALDLDLPAVEATPQAADTGTSRFDLTLALFSAGGRLEGRLEYARDLFDRPTVERWAGHLSALLAAVVERPGTRLWELPLLSAAERRQVVEEWNAAAPGARSLAAASLHGPVLARAAADPQAVALVVGQARWSYGWLAARSAALAARLRALGVGFGRGAEVRVGVCLERHGDLVAALLAVLSAGGAYVPIDPAYPADRVRVMLEDGAVEALITEDGVADRLPRADGVRRLLVGDVPPPPPRAKPPTPVSRPVSPDQLAYVLFTSGSTGRPKGVAIPHRGAAALVAWARRRYSAAELSAVLAATSVCFDLSVFELFAPLSAGGRVILVDDALALSSAPAREQVTLVNTVPSALSAILAAEGLPASVRTVNLAGEALAASLAEAVYATGTVERLYNLYGPSEDTTYSTWSLVPRPDPRGDRRPPAIGRPLSDTRAYVLDRLGRPVPVGVTGELCLAGAGLARGYLERPAQTAAAFVPDPFAAAGGEPGGRLYRTGDLAHWRPGGELVFQGRADQQVKLRGFRIELGEVEAALAALPGVAEAAVAVWEDRLAGYVVGEDGRPPDAAELRQGLSARLPAFMVPDLWHPLPALPRTPNGKLDRRALPWPWATAAAASEPPRGAVEVHLAALWSELLGVPEVGRDDGFFALGGHSLLATRLVARLGEELGVHLPVRAVFESPTVAGLARRVEAAGAAADEPQAGVAVDEARAAAPAAPPRPAPAVADQPLSFTQERLWFLDRLASGPVYHLPVALRLEGRLRPGLLRAALATVGRRHAALRLAVHEVDGRPRQRAIPRSSLRPAHVELGRLAASRAAAEEARLLRRLAAAPFDAAAGSLSRVALVESRPGRWALALVLHHLVADAASLAVLVGEVGEIYTAATEGRPPSLPPVVGFPAFAAAERDSWPGAELRRRARPWRRRLAGWPQTLDLALDHPRPSFPSFRGGEVPFRVDPPLWRRLAGMARDEGATPFMLLMAAYQLLLARRAGQGRLLVGVPVAARPSGAQGEVGPFVTTRLWRGEVAAATTFRDLLAATREESLEVAELPHLPFEKLVEALAPERDLSRNPLFQAMLAFQNVGPLELRLPGVTSGPLAAAAGTARFDLTLTAYEADGGLSGALEYAADLFDGTTAAGMVGEWVGLLRRAVDEPSAPLWPAGPAPSDAASAPRPGTGSPPATRPPVARQVARPVPPLAGPAGDGEAETPPEPPLTAPPTATELWVADVWRRELRVERLERTSDFFDLGGHSLLAQQVMARLSEALGLDLPTRFLFEERTLSRLASRIERSLPDVPRAPSGRPGGEPS